MFEAAILRNLHLTATMVRLAIYTSAAFVLSATNCAAFIPHQLKSVSAAWHVSLGIETGDLVMSPSTLEMLPHLHLVQLL